MLWLIYLLDCYLGHFPGLRNVLNWVLFGLRGHYKLYIFVEAGTVRGNDANVLHAPIHLVLNTTHCGLVTVQQYS